MEEVEDDWMEDRRGGEKGLKSVKRRKSEKKMRKAEDGKELDKGDE